MTHRVCVAAAALACVAANAAYGQAQLSGLSGPAAPQPVGVYGSQPPPLLGNVPALTQTNNITGVNPAQQNGLTALAQASVTYDSRVDGGADHNSAVILALEPDVFYRRNDALLKLAVSAGVTFERYLSARNYDNADVHTGASVILPEGQGSNFSGTFSVNYVESSNVDYTVNQHVTIDTLSSELTGKLVTGLRTDVTADGQFSNESRSSFGTLQQYTEDAGFDYKNFLGGTNLNLLYTHLDSKTSGGGDNVAGELDQHSDTYNLRFTRQVYAEVNGIVSYGYTFLTRGANETVNGQRHEDSADYSVGLNGPFLPQTVFPKLTSSFSVVYQKSVAPGINDTNAATLVGSLNVGWQARTETTVSVSASRSMALSLSNLSVAEDAFQIGVTEQIGDFSYLSADVGYDIDEYRGTNRDDTVYLADLAFTHQLPGKPWTFRASYSLRDTRSPSDPQAAYGRSVVTVSVTYRF